MSVLKYLEKCQSGFLGSRSSRSKRGEDFLNSEFVLPTFKTTAADAFVVRCQDGEEAPPTAMQFCAKYGREHILAVSNEEGGVSLLNTNVPLQKSLLTRWDAHTNAIFDICWTDSNLLTSSGDKTVQLWDTTVQKHICTMKGHTSSVKTIDMQPHSSSVFASGSRDGNIMVWDTRKQTFGDHHTPVIVIHNAHDAHSTFGAVSRHRRRIVVPEKICVVSPLNAVSCIRHQNEHLLISAGASDSEIKLWDLRISGKRSAISNRAVTPKGYSSMAMHPSQTSFFVNGVDGIIFQYSCSKHDLVATYYGHKVNTYFVKLAVSGDGKYLISGSSDDKAYIWKTSKPGPPLVCLSGHSDEVTSVAWSATDFTKVVTSSDDARLLRWNLQCEKPLPFASSQNNFVGEAEEIDREATVAPPSLEILTNSKAKECKTPRSGSHSFSPVLTRWLTPQRSSFTPTPINVTPVKRTFTLPKKRQLSDEDRENDHADNKRAPRSPDSKNVLTQRQCNSVARSLNCTFSSKENTQQGESSKKTALRNQSNVKTKKAKKLNSRTSAKKDRPAMNSIKNYFQSLSRT